MESILGCIVSATLVQTSLGICNIDITGVTITAHPEKGARTKIYVIESLRKPQKRLKQKYFRSRLSHP